MRVTRDKTWWLILECMSSYSHRLHFSSFYDRFDISVTGTIPVYVYTPNNLVKDPPILVYFHGGGMVIGCRENVETTCQIISAYDIYDSFNPVSRFTLGVFGVGFRPPAPPGDRLWQTLTYFRNPNVETSSYRYTSIEWLSDIPTNFGLPPVRCSQWHKSGR